jgi:hypothetical protein
MIAAMATVKMAAEVIDLAAAARAVLVEIYPESSHRRRPDRQIDPKDPGPGQMLDNEAASKRSDDCRNRPDACEPALDLRPLMRRIEVADDGHRHGQHRARAHALHESEDNQRRHRPSEAAQHRADQKDPNADSDDGLPPDEIGKLAKHYGRCSLGQKEGGEHPAIKLQTAKLADNLRHGGRDNGRLQSDHET